MGKGRWWWGVGEAGGLRPKWQQCQSKSNYCFVKDVQCRMYCPGQAGATCPTMVHIVKLKNVTHVTCFNGVNVERGVSLPSTIDPSTTMTQTSTTAAVVAATRAAQNKCTFSLPLSSWLHNRELKHDGDGWRERHKTKGLISKTMTLHVRYRFWYISLPSSAKQQRETTKFKFYVEREHTTVNFSFNLPEL